jgi:KipI family sensor histidine kinase inhibitor
VNVRFLPAGDLALVVEFSDPIGDTLNARLRALETLLGDGRVAGVTEIVPSFRSLLVYYEPEAIGYEALCQAIAERIRRSAQAPPPPARSLDVPCCYSDPALGFELQAAAQQLGMAAAALVQRHAASEYLVYFIGFAPGQPYLTGLPQTLAIPRLQTPRTRTPPGSVGIGGDQCCIYSVESPGGFWVLGRTPLRLYDAEADEPTLLRPGDRLRFRPIGRAEYDRIERAVEQGVYRVAGA